MENDILKQRLAKIILTWPDQDGKYSEDRTYRMLDCCQVKDKSYVSIQDNNAGHPVSDRTWWRILFDGELISDELVKKIMNGESEINNLFINKTDYKKGQDSQDKEIETLKTSISENADNLETAKKEVSDALNAVDTGVKSLDTRKKDKIIIQDHGQGDMDFTLTPDIYHVWGEVGHLNLSLPDSANDTEEELKEYMFQFESPLDNPTTLTLPETLHWINDLVPPIEPGRKYQASIVDGLIILVGSKIKDEEENESA